MKMPRFVIASHVLRAALLASLLFGLSGTARAVNATWNGTTDALWSTTTNWSASPVPGVGNTATFNNAGNANTTITVGTISLSNITFDTASAAAYTLGSGTITFADGTTTAVTVNSTVTANETINANITLGTAIASNTTFANNGTGLLTLGGNIAGGTGGTAAAKTVTVTGTGNTTVGGVISNGGATSVALTKNSGTGTLTLTGANTFTGATTLSTGTLALSGASGAMTGTSGITLGSAATLSVDDSTANANRLKDSAGITFNSGGVFKYQGSSSSNSTESIGAITLNGGVATITVNSGGSNTATVTAAAATGGLTRSYSGTNTPGIALINGVNLGSSTSGVGRVLTVTAPTLVGTTAGGTTGINSSVKNTQIVSYLLGESGTGSGQNGTALGTANTFLTYNSTNGYRPLNPTDEFTNNAISAGNNTYITSATTSTGTAAINSLVINGGNLVINDGTTLTNTSGALLFASSNTIAPSSSTGALGFGAAEGIISVNSGINATISSAITGTGGLTVYGPGTLTLNGSSGSGLSGTTNIINGGNLVIGSDTALGSSLLRTNGGTISVLTQPRTISNTLSLNSSGSQTLAGTGDLTLAGSGSNPALSVVHQVNPVFNITNVGAITISGAYALDNGATVNNNPVGPTLASSANFVITGPIYDTNSSNVVSGLGSQAIFKFNGAGANLKIIGNNNFGGTQTNSTTITPAVGAGYNTITIGGSTSTITPFGLGTLTTNSGVGFFLVANESGKTLGNNISLGASTSNDNGRPIGFDGTNDLTLGGTFTLGASVSLPNISSATLTFGNTVALGGSTLTILGSGNTTFNSASTITGTTGSFSKTGPGTLTLAGASSISGASNSVTLNGGTTILDYSAADANRIPQGTTSTALTLSGANLQLKGGAYTQVLGTGGTTLNAGQSKITQTGGGSSKIALGAITRTGNNGAAIDFGTGAATTTTSNSASGILGGYATVGGADWAVANGGSSAITALSSYSTLTGATTTTANNYVFAGDATGLTTSATAQAVNTLKITTSASGALTLGNTLNIVTGGLLFTGSNNYQITGGIVKTSTSAATDLVVHQYGSGELEIASQIVSGNGAAGLTKAGTGTLVLSNANNTYSGTTFLDGGILKIGASGNLGTGGLSFNGGTLQTTAGFVTTRTVALASNGGTFQVDSGTLEISGVVSGGYGGLTKTGSGTLLLSGSNAFTGPTTITNGTLKLGNALGLGTSATTNNKALAPVTVNGGTLDIASYGVGLGNVTLSSGSIIDSVGGGSVGAYSFTLQSGTVSAALADVAVPVATNVSNSINVYKTTAGTVILSGANTYTGNTNISGGTLQSAKAAALGSTGVVNVSNAGTTLAVNYGGVSDYTQAQVGTLLAKTNFGATTTVFAFDTTNGGGAYGNALTMAAGLTKLGTNTLTLSGANTYTGATTVSAGTLALSGSGTFGTGSLTVSGGTADLGGKSITNPLGSLTGGGVVNNGTVTNNSGTYDVQNGSVGAVLAGSNGLNKTTGGTVTLSSANLYSGNTVISGGTLALGSSGSIASSIIQNNATFNVSAVAGGFSVASGQTLKGSGTVVGSTTISSGGTVSPGNSPGLMTFGDALTLASGSTTLMEIGGSTSAGADYDKIAVTGQIAFGGTLTIVAYDLGLGLYNIAQPATLDLFGFGSQTGNFTSVSVVGTSLTYDNGTSAWSAANVDGYNYSFSLSTGDLIISAATIPEPSTYAGVFGVLALAAAAIRRRRRG